MSYTKQGPFVTGGTCTAANLTAMDNGIAAAVPLDGSVPMTGDLTAPNFHGLADSASLLQTQNTPSRALKTWDFTNNIGIFPSVNNMSLAVQGIDGSGNVHNGLTVAPDGTASIGSVRNGSLTPARIFTGSTTPSNPNVGDIWFPG